MSPDCILGLHATPVPTAEQCLLVATHPSQVPRLRTYPIFADMPFHLSAADFSRSVFRVPPAGFHLADLRANPGPKAHISLLSALRTEVMRTPASLAKQSLLRAYHPTQVPQLTQRSRVHRTEVRFTPPMNFRRNPLTMLCPRGHPRCVGPHFRFYEAEALRPVRSTGYP